MSGRRLGYLSFAAFFVVVALALIALALSINVTDTSPFFMGAFLCGPIGLILAVRCIRWRSAKDLEAMHDPTAIVQLAMTKLERYSAGFALLVMAIGFAFGIRAPDATLRVLSWCGMIGFPLLAIMALMVKRPASLRLTPEGLDFSAFNMRSPIPWKDIRAARPMWALGRVPMVALDLNNEEVYRARRRGLHFPRLDRFFLSSSFTVMSPAMEISCDMLAKAIEIRIAAFGRGSQPA